MEDPLPFPLKLALLMVVLPLAFAYLGALAGVIFLFARRALGRLNARFRAPVHGPPHKS
jgi:hypothetical protein